MADIRSKAVLHELADLYSRFAFAIDIVSNLTSPLKKGDSIDVPSIASLTVYADGSSSQSAQSVSNSALTLVADRHPWIPAILPAVGQMQNMDGTWAAGVARQAGLMLKNKMDEQLLGDYLAVSLCYDGSATYQDNVAAASLTAEMILNTKATLLGNDGTMPQDLALFVSPYAEASIQKIPGFTLNMNTISQGALGLPFLGTVCGVPVYTTNSVKRLHTVATSAVTISSNVATATVAAGHGIEVGVKVKNAGLTNSSTNTTAQTVSAVTATTVVFPYTASDGAQGDGVGTLIVQSSMNIMMNKAQVFVAQQAMPQGRIVQDPSTTGDILQVSSIWGRIGRAGHVRVLHSPASAA